MCSTFFSQYSKLNEKKNRSLQSLVAAECNICIFSKLNYHKYIFFFFKSNSNVYILVTINTFIGMAVYQNFTQNLYHFCSSFTQTIFLNIEIHILHTIFVIS